MTADAIARLIEVPAEWENGGDFQAVFDGVGLVVTFGDSKAPVCTFHFDWVRSFRYVSEATRGDSRDRVPVDDALLSELPLPDPKNPSSDDYGSNPEIGKGPPRLFRLFHYKAGLIEVAASDWEMK